jgi:hypothetical protein
MAELIGPNTFQDTFGVEGQGYGYVGYQDNGTQTDVGAQARTYASQQDTAKEDFRVRLAAQTRTQYNGELLSPLLNTGGLLFPYTPTITVSQEVDYANMQMVHSNMDYYSYSRTPNTTISLAGKFTVQNQKEGLYALAAIHFLKTMSKMYFGEKDAGNNLAGLPPPILLLKGYGKYMFNNIRVILKSHNYTFEESAQTVAVNTISGGIVRLPALFTLSCSLVSQPTTKMMRKDFSLDSFRSGELLKTGGYI